MKKQGVFEERRELLKGVSGVFRPRVLTALMGVSGAGKTTLMDVTFKVGRGANICWSIRPPLFWSDSVLWGEFSVNKINTYNIWCFCSIGNLAYSL